MGRRKVSKSICLPFLLALAAVLLSSTVVSANDQELPPGFRFVGNYLVDERVKVTDEGVLAVAMRPFVCRVYTDGVAVRVYGNDAVDGYTSFTIYRNEGVIVSSDGQSSETIPGVQARSMVGGVMRQLTLTGQGFVLTKFPALSDVVEITRASRRITLSRQ